MLSLCVYYDLYGNSTQHVPKWSSSTGNELLYLGLKSYDLWRKIQPTQFNCSYSNKNWGTPGLFFRLLNAFCSTHKSCQCLDSNLGSLVLEATILQTAPQPLSQLDTFTLFSGEILTVIFPVVRVNCFFRITKLTCFNAKDKVILCK